MRKSRTGMLLVGLTVLALSAGVVAGMLAARLPASTSGGSNAGLPPPAGYERSLADELALDTGQREHMRMIWEGVRGQAHRAFDEARELEHKQLVELGELMKTPEQQEAFKQITKKYADRYDELARERNRQFDDAVDQTNRILKPEQQKKYAEIREKLHQATKPPTTVTGTTEKQG